MFALLRFNLRAMWDEWKRRDVDAEIWSRLRAIWEMK